jgi:hypothetical protein
MRAAGRTGQRVVSAIAAGSPAHFLGVEKFVGSKPKIENTVAFPAPLGLTPLPAQPRRKHSPPMAIDLAFKF